jgi:hypothetical protein
MALPSSTRGGGWLEREDVWRQLDANFDALHLTGPAIGRDSSETLESQEHQLVRAICNIMLH